MLPKSKSVVKMSSDVSIELYTLDQHTSLFEKKPLLSILSIESPSRSEEDRGGQQMSP